MTEQVITNWMVIGMLASLMTILVTVGIVDSRSPSEAPIDPADYSEEAGE